METKHLLTSLKIKIMPYEKIKKHIGFTIDERIKEKGKPKSKVIEQGRINKNALHNVINGRTSYGIDNLLVVLDAVDMELIVRNK